MLATVFVGCLLGCYRKRGQNANRGGGSVGFNRERKGGTQLVMVEDYSDAPLPPKAKAMTVGARR